jgi:hypothetical protein
MQTIPNEYKLELETEHGRAIAEEIAMSEEQIRINMPTEVISYTATHLRARPDLCSVGASGERDVENDLWNSLRDSVSHIQTAVEITPEWLAENAQQQKQALAGMRLVLNPVA